PSTGSRSWRSRNARTVPPWASVSWTARSTPLRLSSIGVPSSGHSPPCAPSRPHFGHSHAGWSTPSWTSRSSTRPSDAASSVFSQPAAALPFRQLRDVAQVVVDQLFDVPLVARLRPAALVVPAGLLVEALLDLLEPAVRQTVEIAPLAPDVRHERAVALPDEPHERGEVERAPELDEIRHA